VWECCVVADTTKSEISWCALIVYSPGNGIAMKTSCVARDKVK